MIIMTGIFRNTSNLPKLYEITIFQTDPLAYCAIYEIAEASSRYKLQMLATGKFLS